MAIMTGAASPSSTPSDETVHPSGITILRSLPSTPTQLPENLGLALDDANRASIDDPADLSFPWVDRASGTLVVAASTPAGMAKAAQFQPARVANTAIRTVSVKHSRAYIQKIMDETVGCGNLADVELTAADPEHNRAILWVDKAASDAFLHSLAAKYDPSAIAVYVLDQPLNLQPLFG